MLPENHPLVSTATKPLADNAEQRLVASALLKETFDADHPSIAETLRRLNKVDSKRHSGKWRVALHICAGISICYMLLSVASIRSGLQIFSGMNPLPSEPPKLTLPKGLTQAERLLLGDPSLPSFQQKEKLHLSAPDRPDFYAEYSGEYFRTHSEFPETYFKTIERIDPDNSFFLYNAAGRKGSDSIEKFKNSSGSLPARRKDGKRLKPVPTETEWKITDQAEYDLALEQISKASKMPRFESYETKMATARLSLLGQDTFLERIRTIAFMAAQTSQIISIRKVGDLFCAEAYRLSIAGDKDAYITLSEQLEDFLSQLATSPDSTLINELVFHVIASSTSNSFYFAAQRLELPGLEEKYGVRKKAFDARSDQRQLQRGSQDEWIKKESSLLGSLTIPMVADQVLNPPEISSQDLTPGRMADHDIFSAFLLPVVSLLMGLALLIILQLHISSPRPIRLLAKRFGLLLDWRDWAWIFSLGVVLPIAAVVLLTRFTQLGGNSFGIRYYIFIFPSVNYALIILLLLTVPFFLVRWRMARHLAAFGLNTRFRLTSIIIPTLGTLSVLLAIPLISAFPFHPITLAGLSLFPALWICVIILCAAFIVFGKPPKRLLRAIPLAALPPTISLAIIILVALQPLFRASADSWIARDDFGRIVPSGLSTYEAEIATELRSETNAILGFK